MGSSRKNVVRVLGYYEDRRENISTQRRRASKSGPTLVPPPKTVNQTDKENSNMEVDFVEVPNLKSHESTVLKNNSHPVFQDLENKGVSFS